MANKPVDVDVKQSIKDIFFTKNDYKLVDDFVINDGKKHPFAILVPGGGYSLVCSFIEGVPIARELNKKNISVFILYYHVKNKALFPRPIDDLSRAVKEIFEKADKYNLDTNNYSIWGASAGGHLVSVFGLKKIGYQKYSLPKPGTLVLIYPVISMDKEISHGGSLKNFLGENPSEELIKKTSTDLNVDSDYPRTFIWCFENDNTVNSENTKRMVKALKDNHVEVESRIFEGNLHGVGPGNKTNAQGWIDDAYKFWRKEEC